jgi:hypothetical protein
MTLCVACFLKWLNKVEEYKGKTVSVHVLKACEVVEVYSTLSVAQQKSEWSALSAVEK